MPDPATELGAVRLLAALSGMNITNIRDAKSVLGPIEQGLDVVCDLDGRRIGVQHTIFHADEGRDAGKRGSPARAAEEATARATQAPFAVWGVLDYRPALLLRLREKCAIAARYPASDMISETWLVVSACLAQWGAAASTMILRPFVEIGELNDLSHDVLCGSRFDRVYLVMHIGSVVFGWTPADGWQIVADPDAQERELHQAQMNDLLFNRLSNHRRSG